MTEDTGHGARAGSPGVAAMSLREAIDEALATAFSMTNPAALAGIAADLERKLAALAVSATDETLPFVIEPTREYPDIRAITFPGEPIRNRLATDEECQMWDLLRERQQ